MTSEPRVFARTLRANQTAAEDCLWQALRGRRLYGLKFRRQVPLSVYTVDFLCLDRHIVIELDGNQHNIHRDYDAHRTADIEAMGFVVLRFRNEQLTGDLDPALREIAVAAGVV